MKFKNLFLNLLLALFAISAFTQQTKIQVTTLGTPFVYTASLDSNSNDTVYFSFSDAVFGGAERALMIQTISGGSPDTSNVITDFYRSELNDIDSDVAYFSDTVKAESTPVNITSKSDYGNRFLNVIIRNTKSEVNDTAVAVDYNLIVKPLSEQ